MDTFFELMDTFFKLWDLFFELVETFFKLWDPFFELVDFFFDALGRSYHVSVTSEGDGHMKKSLAKVLNLRQALLARGL